MVRVHCLYILGIFPHYKLTILPIQGFAIFGTGNLMHEVVGQSFTEFSSVSCLELYSQPIG